MRTCAGLDAGRMIVIFFTIVEIPLHRENIFAFRFLLRQWIDRNWEIILLFVYDICPERKCAKHCRRRYLWSRSLHNAIGHA